LYIEFLQTRERACTPPVLARKDYETGLV
jgi:hypothetical protein